MTDACHMLLCTGGSRSGKSSYAQQWAESRAASRLFIATAYACDGEMAERIDRHRKVRGHGWSTLEISSVLWKEPENMLSAVEAFSPGVILFDCLTLYTSLCLCEGFSEEETLAKTRRLFATLRAVHCPVAVVTNEVGMGLVPTTAEGRAWRDTLGRVNQFAAAEADSVVFLVSGIPLVIKGQSPDYRPSCAVS